MVGVSVGTSVSVAVAVGDWVGVSVAVAVAIGGAEAVAVSVDGVPERHQRARLGEQQEEHAIDDS